MLTMNRVTVLGHAGRNPEIRSLPSGDEVALFSVATNERFRRKDGTEAESTEWHAIVAFGNAARTVRKLVHRGAAVLVEGRIATRTWTDRAGTEHRTSEILVSGPQARVNVLARRKPEPGDVAPPGGAAPAEPERTGAVAAATGTGSSGTAEDGAASSANDTPGRAGNSAAEPEGAGTAAATPGNAGDAKDEEAAGDTVVERAATATGPSLETGAPADAARSDEVEEGSGEAAASSADAPGSPATSDVDAAEPVTGDTAQTDNGAAAAGGAGAASTAPSSEIDAGPGDADSAADTTSSAAAAQPDATTGAATGDDADGVPASEARVTAEEDAGSAGANDQLTSEGAATGTGPATSPANTADETEGAPGVPGVGSVPAAQSEYDGGATDGEGRDSAADADNDGHA